MKTKLKNKLLFTLLANICLTLSWAQVKSVHTVTVKNILDINRSFETVEINKASLTLKAGEDFAKLMVQDKKTKAILVSQWPAPALGWGSGIEQGRPLPAGGGR